MFQKTQLSGCAWRLWVGDEGRCGQNGYLSSKYWGFFYAMLMAKYWIPSCLLFWKNAWLRLKRGNKKNKPGFNHSPIRNCSEPPKEPGLGTFLCTELPESWVPMSHGYHFRSWKGQKLCSAWYRVIAMKLAFCKENALLVFPCLADPMLSFRCLSFLDVGLK